MTAMTALSSAEFPSPSPFLEAAAKRIMQDRLDEARRAIADADADEGATAETLRRPFVLLASARLGGNAVRDVLRRWPEMSDDERRGAFDAMKVVCSDLNV